MCFLCDAETPPTPNLNLIREILSLIKNDPEHWDQERWITSSEPAYNCGTAGCFAGRAIMLKGLELDWYLRRADKYAADFLKDGRSIDDAARDLLGLTRQESAELFDGDNSFEDLKRIAKKIAERAGEKLELGKYMRAKERYNLVANNFVKQKPEST